MIRRLLLDRPRRLVSLGLSLVLVVASLWLLAPSGSMDAPIVRASYDASFALAATVVPELTNSPVVLVYLDLESHLREKQDPAKPWDRALHAALVRRLTQSGARAVVFDVVFAEAGRDAAGDLAFAEAIRASGRVTLAAELNDWQRHTGAAEGVAAPCCLTSRCARLPPAGA